MELEMSEAEMTRWNNLGTVMKALMENKAKEERIALFDNYDRQLCQLSDEVLADLARLLESES